MYPGKSLPVIYLQPGEISVTETPAVVSTVLGSCLSVTLHSRSHRLGAICHAQLPFGKEPGDFKYVNRSLGFMLNSFDRYGVPREDIEIKVFGGSELIGTQNKGDLFAVGKQNIEAALGFFKAEGLKPTVLDIGGKRGRKLFYYPHTGEVLLKRLS